MWSRERGTTTAKILSVNFEKVKKQYLSDICSMVIMEDISEEVINWDQTDWTFAEKGPSELKLLVWMTSVRLLCC